MPTDYKVMVRPMPGRFVDQLFIYRDAGHGKVGVLSLNATGELVETAYPMGVDVPATMQADSMIIRSIVVAFIEHGREAGFKSNDESKAQGMLVAQGEHLKDLRTLLKLK